mmetsp:Transcript_48767/g.161574  ORF Transcript_48767/g.161574 Transcript_48767/m.161574 type:complete len:245 (+) Transcript_48767:741-1475(+)
MALAVLCAVHHDLVEAERHQGEELVEPRLLVRLKGFDLAPRVEQRLVNGALPLGQDVILLLEELNSTLLLGKGILLVEPPLPEITYALVQPRLAACRARPLRPIPVAPLILVLVIVVIVAVALAVCLVLGVVFVARVQPLWRFACPLDLPPEDPQELFPMFVPLSHGAVELGHECAIPLEQALNRPPLVLKLLLALTNFERELRLVRSRLVELGGQRSVALVKLAQEQELAVQDPSAQLCTLDV